MNPTRRDEIMEILRRHKTELAVRYAVTELGVFGSVARGEAGADSDVDIVFKTDKPNLFRTVRLQQELEALLECPVDIVRLREQMNPRLKKRILEEAHYV